MSYRGYVFKIETYVRNDIYSKHAGLMTSRIITANFRRFTVSLPRPRITIFYETITKNATRETDYCFNIETSERLPTATTNGYARNFGSKRFCRIFRCRYCRYSQLYNTFD